MKILLVGYQGYIGSGLFEYLKRFHEVLGWGKGDNILKINNKFLYRRIKINIFY